MEMKMRKRKTWWIGRLAAALMAGVGAAFIPAQGAAPENDVRRDLTVDVVERVNPSVVNIATATIVERAGDPNLEFLRRYFGWRVQTERREEPYSVGSGVIVDEEGYILTNFHVLEHATRVQVKLWDGKVYDAEPLVGTAQKDVAMLKIKANPGEKFKAIKLAKDDDLLLGETVLALGNPYGLGSSVTRGILSSKARRVATGDEPLNAQDWLQTDADINPGNSGGPLINLRGELIGINVAVYRQGAGMGVGFAIPVRHLSSALADFFCPEASPQGVWFGARVEPLLPPLNVTSVMPGSPADKAGLKQGQRIVSVNGVVPRGLADFNRLILADTNHVVTVEVQQGSERRTLKSQLVTFDDLVRQKVGLTLLNPSKQLADSFGVRQDEVLFINEVQKDSPAERARLQPGMLVRGIDGRETGDLRDVAGVLSEKKSGDRVQLSVIMQRRYGNFVQRQDGSATLTVR
jgi:S1-C subfamily serine protease